MNSRDVGVIERKKVEAEYPGIQKDEEKLSLDFLDIIMIDRKERKILKFNMSGMTTS